MAFFKSRDFFPQRRLRLEQRLASTLFAIESVEGLQLDVQSKKRLYRLTQGVQLGARGLHAFQLARDALGVAMQRRLFLFGDVDLGEKLCRLLALTLDHFPAGLHRHQLALTYRTAVRGVLRPRFRFFLARRCLSERAQHGFGVGHPPLHALDRSAHPVALLACQVLGDAQLLVPEHARQKLPAARRFHRRHHVELFLPGEVGVVELGQRHAQSPLQQLVDGGDGVGNGGVGAI